MVIMKKKDVQMAWFEQEFAVTRSTMGIQVPFHIMMMLEI